MSRPAWWLKNRFLNHGKGRLEKWKPFVPPEDLCLTCNEEIKTTHKHWMLHADRWQCHACWLRLNGRIQSISNNSGSIRRPHNWNREDITVFTANVRGSSELSEEGNLDNWMYRYWIGTKYVNGSMRICKCCRMAGYTELFQHEHADKHTPSCCRRLTDAYKRMIHNKLCAVCASNTHRQEYGVPLCTDACISEWKFNQRVRWKLVEEALQATGGFIPPIDGMYSHAQLVD